MDIYEEKPLCFAFQLYLDIIIYTLLENLKKLISGLLHGVIANATTLYQGLSGSNPGFLLQFPR